MLGGQKMPGWMRRRATHAPCTSYSATKSQGRFSGFPSLPFLTGGSSFGSTTSISRIFLEHFAFLPFFVFAAFLSSAQRQGSFDFCIAEDSNGVVPAAGLCPVFRGDVILTQGQRVECKLGLIPLVRSHHIQQDEVSLFGFLVDSGDLPH